MWKENLNLFNMVWIELPESGAWEIGTVKSNICRIWQWVKGLVINATESGAINLKSAWNDKLIISVKSLIWNKTTDIELTYKIQLPINKTGDDEIYFEDKDISYEIDPKVPEEFLEVVRLNDARIKSHIREAFYW